MPASCGTCTTTGPLTTTTYTSRWRRSMTRWPSRTSRISNKFTAPFEAFFKNNGLNTADLQAIFIRHGASGEPYTDVNRDSFYTAATPATATTPGLAAEPFDDQNGNGIWDEDVNWGYTPDNGEFVDLNGNGSYDLGEQQLADQDGDGIWDPPRKDRQSKPAPPSSDLCVSVVDADGEQMANSQLAITREDGANYAIGVPESPGQVFFYMPHHPMLLYTVARREGHRDSLPLVMNSTLYWREGRFSGQPCFATHTFVLDDPAEERFGSLDLDTLQRMELSGEKIGTDAIGEGYALVAVRSAEGRYAKLLLQAADGVDGLELSVARWVTYSPEGTLLLSGGPVQVTSGYGLDPDRGTVIREGGHLRWYSETSGTGYLAPAIQTELGVVK